MSWVSTETAFVIFGVGLATISSMAGYEIGKRVEYWRFKRLIRAKKKEKRS